MADAALTELVAEIVGSYVSNNKVDPGEIAGLIQTVYSSLSTAGQAQAPVEDAVAKATPAQIKKSITPDALISFLDGKSYKTLRRHLATHGLTVDEYKTRYGLPRDYPTTAPSYSAHRSAMAKALGLGARGRSASSEPKTQAKAPTKRGKKTSTTAEG